MSTDSHSTLPPARSLIAAARLASGRGKLQAGFVRIDAGVISQVGHGRCPDTPDLHLETGVLAPGFVDLQVNGYAGHDLADVDLEGWQAVTAHLPSTGVTSFLPTFISAPVTELGERLRCAAEVASRLPDGGARVLGVHAEGPFLSPRRPGAHDPAHLCDPLPSSVEALLDAGAGQVRLVTLAPERAGAADAIRLLTNSGVIASIGHSDASASEVERAADLGARKVTHLFNAQSGIDHRNPGVAAQALTDHRLAVGLIADLVHVAPAACRLAFAAAEGRVILVTDAIAVAGLPPGEYEISGEVVRLPEDGPPTRADGVFVGTSLRLDTAIANLVGIGVDVAVAIDAASRVPADLLGRPDLGRIAQGAAADLVWLDDNLRTRRAWIDGELVFSTAEAEPA